MSTWVIKLTEGDYVVNATRIEVENGHLLAFSNYGAGLEAAWAPGAWTSFWEKPQDESIEWLRGRIIVAERVMEEVARDAPDRWAFDNYLVELRDRLGRLEAREPTSMGASA